LGLSTGSDDPIASATKGAVVGALTWTKEEVAALIAKLRDKNLAFIQNKETIDLVRSERATEEWEILRRHIKEKRLRILAVMGLTLRRLERSADDRDQLQELRKKIHKKYGVDGLQAAELVQRGIVTQLMARFIGAGVEASDIEAAFATLLRNVGRHAVFVKQEDSIRPLASEIKIKVLANSPDLFIILGHGEVKDKSKRVLEAVLKLLPKGYGSIKTESGADFFAILGKLDGGEIQLSLSAQR
jgi:hypothetical protein